MENTLRELYLCYEKSLGVLPHNLSQGYYLNTKGTNYISGGIILYGQEPNGWDKDFDSYSEGIEDIINNRKKTLFCQKIREVWEQSGLINNIAKFASNTNGKHPPINPKDNFWKIMYTPFKFKDKTATIYQHELEILKPQKVLLLCGPGRKSAIECAFQFECGFIDEYLPHLSKEKCANTFDYNGITFMYALHPQAHMSAETRKEYNRRIESFLNK